jgi:H+-transporting ATPase
LYNKRGIASKVKASVDVLADKGYRSLGVAKTDARGNWDFAGIISLSAQFMGVDVKMITGDHIAKSSVISNVVMPSSKCFVQIF